MCSVYLMQVRQGIPSKLTNSLEVGFTADTQAFKWRLIAYGPIDETLLGIGVTNRLCFVDAELPRLGWHQLCVEQNLRSCCHVLSHVVYFQFHGCLAESQHF